MPQPIAICFFVSLYVCLNTASIKLKERLSFSQSERSHKAKQQYLIHKQEYRHRHQCHRDLVIIVTINAITVPPPHNITIVTPNSDILYLCCAHYSLYWHRDIYFIMIYRPSPYTYHQQVNSENIWTVAISFPLEQ